MGSFNQLSGRGSDCVVVKQGEPAFPKTTSKWTAPAPSEFGEVPCIGGLDELFKEKP